MVQQPLADSRLSLRERSAYFRGAKGDYDFYFRFGARPIKNLASTSP